MRKAFITLMAFVAIMTLSASALADTRVSVSTSCDTEVGVPSVTVTNVTERPLDIYLYGNGPGNGEGAVVHTLNPGQSHSTSGGGDGYVLYVSEHGAGDWTKMTGSYPECEEAPAEPTPTIPQSDLIRVSPTPHGIAVTHIGGAEVGVLWINVYIGEGSVNRDIEPGETIEFSAEPGTTWYVELEDGTPIDQGEFGPAPEDDSEIVQSETFYGAGDAEAYFTDDGNVGIRGWAEQGDFEFRIDVNGEMAYFAPFVTDERVNFDETVEVSAGDTVDYILVAVRVDVWDETNGGQAYVEAGGDQILAQGSLTVEAPAATSTSVMPQSTQDTTPDVLPYTGAEHTFMAVLAIAMVLSGVVLVAMTKGVHSG